MKIAALIAVSTILSVNVFAQANSNTPAQLATDKKIINEVIIPAQRQAEGKQVNWDSLQKSITVQYGAVSADRAITKAKIYGSYGRDWTQFSTAIVHYTQTYEDKDSLSLMDKNAKFVLDHSTNTEELKIAQGWVKHAMDKAPGNATYKATYDALDTKIHGK